MFMKRRRRYRRVLPWFKRFGWELGDTRMELHLIRQRFARDFARLGYDLGGPLPTAAPVLDRQAVADVLATPRLAGAHADQRL